MSNKNRAQHSTPRRHGDRNVQTRYSGKHQCGDDHIRESGLHNRPSRTCDGACHEAETGEAVCMDGLGLTLIPEVKVKIRELHIHLDDHMETYNFHPGSMASVLHRTGGDTGMEAGFEEEESDDEE